MGNPHNARQNYLVDCDVRFPSRVQPIACTREMVVTAK